MVFAIIFVVSALGVTGLVALAGWARIERPPPRLDRGAALELFSDEFPDRTVDGIWISPEGQAALARSGDEALIAYRLGDGHTARTAPWSAIEAGQFRRGAVRVRLGDFAAPWASFNVGEADPWPPKLEPTA